MRFRQRMGLTQYTGAPDCAHLNLKMKIRGPACPAGRYHIALKTKGGYTCLISKEFSQP